MDAIFPNSDGIVRVGNTRGRIALYLDETEAVDLAYKYGLDDEGAKELLAAVEAAYPEAAESEPRLGIAIVVER